MNALKKLIYLIIIISLGCVKKVDLPFDLISPISPDSYKEANGIIIFDSTDIKLDSSGSALSTYHKMVKIVSTYGKKKFGELNLGYVSKFMTLEVDFARLITSEGKVINIPRSEIKDVPFIPLDAEGSSGKMFLPDVRVVKVMFPQVDIGVTIEYKLRLKIKKPFMAGRFTDMVTFEGDEPIVKQVYRIEFPSVMKLNYLVKNGTLIFSESSSGDKTIYTWSANNISKILSEPLMPGLSTVATSLIISNISSWEEISSWYYNLSIPAFTADSAIKLKVKELTDTLENQETKVRALFDFVSTQVRYLRTEAVSKEKGFEPALSGRTFERKWGVCRDKAALLVSMLKEVGIESYIVLINVSHRTPREIPTWTFEHAIVAIPRDSGYYYLDPTIEYAREYFPVLEQNREVLLCTADGEDLSFAPYENLENNKIITSLSGSLDTSGNLRAQLVMKAEGFMDAAFRGFRLIPSEQIKQLLEGMVKVYSPRASLDSFNMSDAEDLNETFAIKLMYSVPEYALKKGNELHIIPNTNSTTSMGAEFTSIGSPWGLESRKYPIDFRTPIIAHSEQIISLPKGYSVKKLRKDFNFESKNMRIKFSEKYSKGKLIDISEFSILDPFILASDYKELKQNMANLEQYGKQTIVLIKN